LTEKKDFYAKMKEFDDLAKQVTAELDHFKCGEPVIELRKQLLADKAKIQAAAETMFKDYETKKTLEPDDVMKFEPIVGEFSARFEKLSGSCLLKMAKQRAGSHGPGPEDATGFLPCVRFTDILSME
jgi:hypothetical protein